MSLLRKEGGRARSGTAPVAGAPVLWFQCAFAPSESFWKDKFFETLTLASLRRVMDSRELPINNIVHNYAVK